MEFRSQSKGLKIRQTGNMRYNWAIDLPVNFDGTVFEGSYSVEINHMLTDNICSFRIVRNVIGDRTYVLSNDEWMFHIEHEPDLDTDAKIKKRMAREETKYTVMHDDFYKIIATEVKNAANHWNAFVLLFSPSVG